MTSRSFYVGIYVDVKHVETGLAGADLPIGQDELARKFIPGTSGQPMMLERSHQITVVEHPSLTAFNVDQ